MWLLALDGFFFDTVDIPPAMLTNNSSYLGFGVDRRNGMASSVFFGASPQPATWEVVIKLPTDAARDALIALLSSQRRSQFRLLAQRELYGRDLVSTEAAVTAIDHSRHGAFVVTFESNDSVWLAEEVDSVSKTFTSALDQGVALPVRGNLPTSPVVRITPSTQRVSTTPAVGWKYRRRYAVSNEGDEPLFRYPVQIALGSTTALVSESKARSDGADLRVWLHGLEQSRTLVDWNTSATTLWVVVPALPPGQSLTYDVVYGNALATSADGVDLAYPDLPAFDLTASSNYFWLYRTAKSVNNAGEGLWYLTSPLEGGSADYGVPGAWQPALTFENPNNTDEYVQPRAQRIASGDQQWYQARLYAARWRGPGFDDFAAYEGSNPTDGVTIHNPFGIRSVHAEDVTRRNDAHVKTVVTTTVADTTESTEVLTPQDPPFTRSVIIGRNSGGEGWHVLTEYSGTIGASGGRLYLPSSGAAPISPTFASGWEVTTDAQRILASRTQQFTSVAISDITANTNGDDVLLRQYIYPLPEGIAFTTSDTVKGQIFVGESDAAGDARAQMTVRVMTATSIVRATLLAFDTAALSSEFALVTVGGAYQNRKFPRTGAVALAANYTSVTGDYLVLEIGARIGLAGIPVSFVLGDSASAFLPEDETQTGTVDTYDAFSPWIEFSTNLAAGDSRPFDANWTPTRPLKHFGIACWPYGGGQIPEDAESRVSIEADGDISVHVAAESLYITPLEAETEIYEMATELRVHGGANAVAPYDALLIGNARQGSGPGTPRAAVVLDAQGIQIDTERRTHTLWEPTFATQEELVSAHAVRARTGLLREVDAIDVAAMQRIAQSVPNATFATNLTGWESHQGNGSWSFAVTHDAAVGGDGAGAMKFALTTTTAATILYRNSTYFAVESRDSVEVTAWMRQAEAGAAAPRIGVVWYDASNVVVATALDELDDVLLPPANDHLMVFAGPVPAGATQFRIVLGVTAVANAPGTKWFDDVTATIIRPLRYDGATPKVTDEIHASQWLPIAPPQRLVANADFGSDIASWELLDDGTGITQTTTWDGTVGGEQVGSLKIAITANTGSESIVYVTTQYYDLNGQERVEMGAWVRTSNASLHPRLAVYWYSDENDTAISSSPEPSWAANPTTNTGFTRTFAAVAPPGATRFRLALIADAIVSTTTGNVWFDDVRLGGNVLTVSDVSMGEIDVTALVRPRWVP